MSLPEGTGRTLLAALVLLGAAIALQRVFLHGLRPPPPTPAVEAERAPQGEGPVMDLTHLRPEDLEFLQSIFSTGTPPGRRSAARALASSGDVRGVPMLFEAARDYPEESLPFCLSALEILRLRARTEALRTLVVELEQPEPLPEACRAELVGRVGLLDRGDPEELLILQDDPSPLARAWLARRVSEEPGSAVDAALLALASDPDALVRRAAWLAWSSRDTGAMAERLSALAESETQPELRTLAQEVLTKP